MQKITSYSKRIYLQTLYQIAVVGKTNRLMPASCVSVFKIFVILSFIDVWVKQQRFRSDFSMHYESLYPPIHFFDLSKIYRKNQS